jgi:hypothetical protein
LILIEAFGVFMDTAAHDPHVALQAKLQVQAVQKVERIAVGLNAAILAVQGDEPVVAVVAERREERNSGDGALPCGLFSPRLHDGSLETALRSCVQAKVGIKLGATRQICTLGAPVASNGSAQAANEPGVAVSYLALVDPSRINDRDGASWRSWYAYFPWEDWRRGKPGCLTEIIEPRLRAWARSGSDREADERGQRMRIAFGCDGTGWDEEKALDRYELLSEAGLLEDSRNGSVASADPVFARPLPRLRDQMLGDQLHVLASAIGELRRSVKRQPVVFELMPAAFTLFELQKTVEAILGPHLHKQNFRRLVETGGLVEPTGEFRLRTGGRPAQLYRFRRDVLLERPAPGVRIRAGRG